MNKSHNDKVAGGLIIGFFVGVLIDNVSIGLIVGLLIGCLPKFLNNESNKDS